MIQMHNIIIHTHYFFELMQISDKTLNTRIAYSREVTPKSCKSSADLIAEEFWTIRLMVAFVNPDNKQAPNKSSQ